MKIRNGYVSNSSSSSYLIKGFEAGNLYDMLSGYELELDFKNKQYRVIGKFLYDEDANDYIVLDEEIFNWFKKHKDVCDFGNGEIIELVSETDNNCVNLLDYQEGMKVWSIKASHNSSDSIEDLEKRYFIKR